MTASSDVPSTSNQITDKVIENQPRLRMIGFMIFYVSEQSLKQLISGDNFIRLNLLFLNKVDKLPRFGFSAYSPQEIHSKDLPRVGLDENCEPYVKTHKYTSRDPEWVYQNFEPNDVVQFYIAIKSRKIHISYEKNRIRSPIYVYELPPGRSDVHIVLFILKPMRHSIRLLTDFEYQKVINEPKELENEEKQSDIDCWECSVCMENQVDRVLECGHVFCQVCIKKWQSQKSVKDFPVCFSCKKSAHTMNVIKSKTCQCQFCLEPCANLEIVSIPCGCLIGCYKSCSRTDLPNRCVICKSEVVQYRRLYF